MLNLKCVSLDEAKTIAAAASAKAKAEGWPVVIAVVDPFGHLVYLERTDGTQVASVIVAQDKARTAALFKRPSKALEDAVLARPVLMSLAGATPVEGGLPLIHEGQVVGAIGVSGVTSAQDGQVALAGVEALAAD